MCYGVVIGAIARSRHDPRIVAATPHSTGAATLAFVWLQSKFLPSHPPLGPCCCWFSGIWYSAGATRTVWRTLFDPSVPDTSTPSRPHLLLTSARFESIDDLSCVERCSCVVEFSPDLLVDSCAPGHFFGVRPPATDHDAWRHLPSQTRSIGRV